MYFGKYIDMVLITRFSDLPEELVVEILALRPTDSLLDCRSYKNHGMLSLQTPDSYLSSFTSTMSPGSFMGKACLMLRFFNNNTGTAPGEKNPFTVGNI